MTRQIREDEAARADRPVLLGLDGAAVHQRFRYRDAETALRFGAAMAARGVLWHHACTNVCAAHTDEQIERVIQAAADAERELRR